MSAEEALGKLGVKAQTLYANVSRGRIRARPDPADQRRSLYKRSDVERLAARSRGRPKGEAVAAETMQWGNPIMSSALTTIADGRLYYRGQDAVALADTAPLEQIAELLWRTDGLVVPIGEEQGTGVEATFAWLAKRAAADLPSHGRRREALNDDAVAVLGGVVTTLAGVKAGALHERLAYRWSRPDAADALRRALVLLADHEFNASTFATRVAVSTGASLAAGALAGLCTLSGPRHGRAAFGVQVLLRRAREVGASAAVRERLGEGEPMPAFGHPLYPQGDARAAALLAAIPRPRIFDEVAEAAESMTGERPNVDFALAAIAATYDLPPEAPMEIFALGRVVGWLAHMLEQAEDGGLVRPRARYVGVAPMVT